jgi:hypothetical protein
MGVNQLRRHLHRAVWLACCLAGPPGCDCEQPPDLSSNQDPESLAPCPALPAGVEPIEGLYTGQVTDRFDGLTLTLSTRPLACGETAAQHDYCGDDERGVTFGFPAEHAVIGSHFIKHPLHVEFEAPGITSVGGGGSIREAQVELFEITDACVTGRIVGFTDVGGPFDGGFQAPRCTP